MLVGPCGFSVARDSRYLTISRNNGATVVSDMACIVWLLGGSGYEMGGCQKGGAWGVQGPVQSPVAGPGAGGIDLLSVQCIQMYTSAWPCVALFSGLQTVSMHHLQPGC